MADIFEDVGREATYPVPKADAARIALKQARKAAGYASGDDAAAAFGWTKSTYRSHESGLRNYSRETARQYARAFRIDPKAIYLDPEDDELAAEPIPVATPRLQAPEGLSAADPGIEMAGVVEAGAWREVDDHDQRPARRIRRSRDNRFPKARQYVWQVAGDSMDLAHIPDGIMILGIDYIDFIEHYGGLGDGRFVIVEKRDNGRREWTVKEAKVFRDRIELRPRSSNPKHQTIVVPLDHEVEGDGEVRILAIVAEAFWQF